MSPYPGAALVAATILAPMGAHSQAATTGLYTQNSICRQNNCINPLFPGLNDLPRLEGLVWQCSTNNVVGSFLDFCAGAILHDPALPSPNSTNQLVSTIVKSQDDAAATMFVYHLSGMGYDAWDHQNPGADEDECVRSVWKMVCFTYFPKAQSGCSAGQASTYLRPCSGSCSTYLTKCKVECCDESPQCVFSHNMGTTSGGISMIQTGYVDALGPSAMCTGTSGGRRSMSFSWVLLFGIFGLHWMSNDAPSKSVPTEESQAHRKKVRGGLRPWMCLGVLIVMACSLHGCDMDVPKHSIGNWRKKQDYLVNYEFIQPGQSASQALLNSCMVPGLSPTLQCSGHGYCKEWNSLSTVANPVSFCVCDRDWVDPECRTRRKSQVWAFVLSVFGGFLGLDYFYLGFPLWGLVKLITLGACGLWWILDIVRTGAGPVYAYNFRVAHDLPHWVFVLVTITLFMVAGFLLSLESYLTFRKRKRQEIMQLKESEECRMLTGVDQMDGPRYSYAGYGNASRSMAHTQPEFRGYGAALPRNLPNAGAPYAEGAPQPYEYGHKLGSMGQNMGMQGSYR